MSQANFEPFAFHLMSLMAARFPLSFLQHMPFSALFCRCFFPPFSSSFLEWLHRFVVYHVFFQGFVQLDSPFLPSASKADLQESFRDMTLHYFKSFALLIFMPLEVTCEDKHQVPQHGVKSDWVAKNTLTHKSWYSLQCLPSLLSLMRFLEFI